MSDIGNLIIRIGADASELEKAFTKLGGSAAQFQRGLESIGKIASAAFLAAAAGATAMAIAAGKQAEQFDQLSRVTGINTDKLQEYDVMLNRAGLSGDDLAVAMKKMSVSMDQARLGTGTAGDRFRQLGIDIRSVTSTDDLIRKITGAASQFADGLQKDAIMAELLGRGWQVFLKAFGGGKKAFDEAAEASKRLGLTMSGPQLAAMVKMDDAIDDMWKAWQRFGQQLGVFVAPSISMIVNKLQELLAWGSHAFNGLSLVMDIFATRLTHMALKANEVLGTLFSTNVFSGEAWKQVMSNLEFIDKQTDLQIAKLRSAAALARAAVPADNRPNVPAFIDSAKVSQQQIALLDVQLKAKQANAQQMVDIGRSLTNFQLAELDRERAYGNKTDMEYYQDRKGILAQQDRLEIESIDKMIAQYQEYVAKKKKLFTDDDKGRAESVKFEAEAVAELAALDTKRLVTMENAKTAEIQAGLQVKTFWIQQLQDIAAANTFATAQIISTWTNGVANSFVNGGNFVKAAWKSTEVALIQGILNVAVQAVAKEALRVAAAIAADQAIVASNAAKNAEMAGSDVIAAALHTSVWAAASLAVEGWFAATAAAFKLMVANLVEVMTAVGEWIEGVLIAIADALEETIFGSPWAVAILAGVILIAGALAATGNLGFREGGIGDFGEGTPAMLHGTEAVIPLDSRGANFMREAFGGGGGGEINIKVPVNIDGRQIAFATARHTPAAWRNQGAPA